LPAAAAQDEVHRIIYDELCRGRIDPASRHAYQRIIQGLAQDGAQAVILGCTEIGLLIAAADSPLPVFDTTHLHAAAAVDWMLA
jgi:aspartate racemase